MKGINLRILEPGDLFSPLTSLQLEGQVVRGGNILVVGETFPKTGEIEIGIWYALSGQDLLSDEAIFDWFQIGGEDVVRLGNVSHTIKAKGQAGMPPITATAKVKRGGLMRLQKKLDALKKKPRTGGASKPSKPKAPKATASKSADKTKAELDVDGKKVPVTSFKSPKSGRWVVLDSKGKELASSKYSRSTAQNKAVTALKRAKAAA